MRKILPVLTLLLCICFTAMGQNRDLQFVMNPVPDSMNVGDSLVISGYVINHGPASFAIPKNKAIAHLQGLESTQIGTAAQKPDHTLFNTSGSTIVLHAGDSLQVDIPLVMNLSQLSATGGGGGLDVVIIIWPSRSYEPSDPNHENNTDADEIHLKEASLSSFTTSLDKQLAPNWTIYPNPAQDLLTCSFQQPGNYDIRLLSLNGQDVLPPVTASSQQFSLSLEGIPAGMYLLYIRQEDRANSSILLIR